LWTPRNAVARTRWLQGFESSGIIFDATLGMHWLLPGKPRSDTGEAFVIVGVRRPPNDVLIVELRTNNTWGFHGVG
jgi:hypothetical protein